MKRRWRKTSHGLEYTIVRIDVRLTREEVDLLLEGSRQDRGLSGENSQPTLAELVMDRINEGIEDLRARLHVDLHVDQGEGG